MGANSGMIDAQLVIVGLCVAAAATWLAARVARSFRGKTAPGCGTGCGDCDRRSDSAKNAADGFVSLDQLIRKS